MRHFGITMRIGFMCPPIQSAIAAAVAATAGTLVGGHKTISRPSRRLIHTSGIVSELPTVYKREDIEYKLSRSLGVGLEDMKYGKGKGKTKSKGEGKGKGHTPDDDGGKHDDDRDDEGTDESQDGPSPIAAPVLAPVHSPVAFSPSTHYPPILSPVYKDDKKEKKKSSKTEKSKLSKSSKKDSPTHEQPDSPVSSPSEDVPSRPPLDMPSEGPPTSPSEPTSPPDSNEPTSSPAGEPDIVQILTPYILNYTTTDERIPFRSEYLEVVELTRVYLEGFFIDIYGDSSTETLSEFLTLFTGSEFDFGQPIAIFYSSSAVFDATSSSVPSVEDLDENLASAFQGENLNGYVSMMQALPTSNVFSTTASVDFELTGGMRDVEATQPPESSERNVTTAAAAMAGTSVFLLFVACLMLKRRRNEDDEYDASASLTGKPPGTIAGETYATATEWSVDQMSVPVARSFDPYEDDVPDDESLYTRNSR